MKKGADKGPGGLQKGRWHRMVRYLVVSLGCLLVVNGLVGEKGVLQILKKRREAQILEQRVAAARAENARLSQEMRRLQHDAGTIEDLARRNLGLIKPGEKVYTIRDARPGTPPPADK